MNTLPEPILDKIYRYEHEMLFYETIIHIHKNNYDNIQVWMDKARKEKANGMSPVEHQKKIELLLTIYEAELNNSDNLHRLFEMILEMILENKHPLINDAPTKPHWIPQQISSLYKWFGSCLCHYI
jgi:hypothetical protein